MYTALIILYRVFHISFPDKIWKLVSALNCVRFPDSGSYSQTCKLMIAKRGGIIVCRGTGEFMIIGRLLF